MDLDHWCLNPGVDFLNHGSFGATPRVVLESQRHWIERLERDPIEFLAPERSLLPKLDEVRRQVSQLIGADAMDVAFVRNATEGVNAVLRSFPLAPGDQVVITSHGYNACNNAVRYAAQRNGAHVVVVEVPFPIESADQVIAAVESQLNSKTRLVLVDHVTSPTGLVFPVKQIAELAHHRNIPVMVDGAHAPGMVAVDVQDIDADYYTANHHKWLCGPKTSGLLYVRRELQHGVRPTIISHGANTDFPGCTQFLSEFNWVGTYDPTPILALPTAIDFLDGLRDGGLAQVRRENRELALEGRKKLIEAMRLDLPAPDGMIGSLASVPLPMISGRDEVAIRALQRRLFTEHHIEVPIFMLGGKLPCIRISAQVYNRIDQYERLAEVLRISCT